ncbi:MAG TPA: putative glycoside hydrolase, partial [Steroidobacteraceae bacterium]
EGEGVADVLFRSAGAKQYDFTGRLAFSWPETAMPATFDAAGKVSGALFARGWGLDYGSAASSQPLSEDPRLPPNSAVARGTLFHAGHVVAPWSIFVADDSAEVHLTTARQESPRGTVVATLEPDGVSAEWAGQEGMVRISGRAHDLRPRAKQGDALDVRYRVDRAPARRVKIGERCTQPLCGTRSGAMLDVTRVFQRAVPGTWQTLSIPLSCFADGGADLADVEVPFAIETTDRFRLTISEVRLAHKPAGRAPGCPGTI